MNAETQRLAATRMADALRHRGPDDGGVWTDADAGVAFAHRRLSILDLSPLGHQPMASPDGRFVVAFNGEIYNFRALRRELEKGGYPFRGHSDTEVLLGAVSQWGVPEALRRFNGMFAFALWDRQERRLYLARDRMGEKPLYYGRIGASFVFASELKALREFPDFDCECDRDVVALFLRHNYVPAPYSIYKGIRKLLPGTYLALDDFESSVTPDPVEYWSVKSAAENGMSTSFNGTASEAIAELDALLRDAVTLRMESDVPLGAFLSGGIDSSVVVALMQASSSRPVKTFTIGFSEGGYDEAPFAREVARHLGTDHTELYVTPTEAMAVIPKLPALYDEPFSDSSQIPTFLVCELARRNVTVSLSGDGGDELFFGYTRYAIARRIWALMGWLPVGARHAIAKIIDTLPSDGLSTWLHFVAPVIGKYGRPGPVGHKIRLMAEFLGFDSRQDLYRRLISHWKDPNSIVLGASEPKTHLTDRMPQSALGGFASEMMYLDMMSYLPDDILAKVDRASMGVSLEVRVPLLDHRVVEFAWRVPQSMKQRQGKGKWLLRQVLYKYVPEAMLERPKMGFGVPIGHWLRGPLRGWAEELLDPVRIRNEGYFNPEPIHTKWQEHISGSRNWQYYLWDVLMFQAWKERWH